MPCPKNPLLGSRERAKRPMNPLRGLRVSKRPPCDAVRIWKAPGEPPAVSNFCGSTLGARALLQSLPDHRSARASQAFPSSCSSRSLRSKRKPAKASAAWPVAGPEKANALGRPHIGCSGTFTEYRWGVVLGIVLGACSVTKKTNLL